MEGGHVSVVLVSITWDGKCEKIESCLLKERGIFLSFAAGVVQALAEEAKFFGLKSHLRITSQQ